MEDARKSLFGETKDVEKSRSISKTIKPYIDYCFALENKETVIKVISLMEIDIHTIKSCLKGFKCNQFLLNMQQNFLNPCWDG